jgi:hypothetical protein
LFVVVVIDDAQKRSPIAPSLRKEKCIIYSQGTYYAPPSRHKQRVQASFSSRAARSRAAFSPLGGIASSATNHLKIKSQKKRFVPLQTTKNRREESTRKIERLRMTRLQ